MNQILSHSICALIEGTYLTFDYFRYHIEPLQGAKSKEISSQPTRDLNPQRSNTKVTSDQAYLPCDQMARLFLIIWLITTAAQIFQKIIKLPGIFCLKFCQTK